jgi:ABC-type transporter Mla MlaB component
MLKIDTANQTETSLTVTLAGTIEEAYLPELDKLVRRAGREGRRLSFDLSQVRMVDRPTVVFLVSGAGRGVRLTGCPAYLRRWLDSENRNRV